jgi:hypothetical protein
LAGIGWGLRHDHDFGATDVSPGYYDSGGDRLTEIALRHQAENLTFIPGADVLNGGDSTILTGSVTGNRARWTLASRFPRLSPGEQQSAS